MHQALAAEPFDHELLEVFHDAESGVTGAIALHSTRLGPAMGGLRLCAYPSVDALVADALRLSRAMSYKTASAGLPLGGGKAVLLDDGGWDGRRRERLVAFARVLHRLGGRYVTAEDVGTRPDDMEIIAGVTSYVAGRPPETGGSGDPSPATARTVFAAIRDAVATELGRPDLHRVRVGVLGVGSVGSRLAGMLRDAGADVVVADVDPARVAATGAVAMTPTALLGAELDVLAPCALGGVLEPGIAARLRCRIVAGAANNQLAADDVAGELHDAGVLYVPDFLANSGGIVHVGAEALGMGPAEEEERIAASIARTAELLRRARSSAVSPLRLALDDAERRLRKPEPEAVAA